MNPPLSTTKVRRLNLENNREQGSRAEFIEGLFLGLTECGFAVIHGHGIKEKLLQDAYALNEALFALPLEEKMTLAVGQGGERGYTAFGREYAKDNPHADLKEFWHIGPELSSDSPYAGAYPDNVWPTEPAEFKTCFLGLYRQLLDVAQQLLQAVGRALDLQDDFFDDLTADGNSVLRLIHYPPVAGMNTELQMRAAPHADINLMTLLVGATDSGLQLLDHDGSWINVESEPGDIIVDTGDMMARLTNHALPATIHRVINPDNSHTSRYSMPFFVHPHGKALLECLPQFKDGSEAAPITAGDFLEQRLRENGLKS
ncbi:MAG: 2-oxoglutarate and iron-dependent oxygenase domain-containing protein [Pseudomonadota bacterium]